MKISQLPFFRHVNFHPDRGELRRFAIAMVVGFTILGALAAWHTSELSTRTFVLWGIGIALAACAFIPGLGRIAYLGVYLPSSVVGYVVSHVVLALLFFLVFVPIGIMLRLTGKDLLRLRPGSPRALWMPLEPKDDIKSYYRQF